MRKSLEKKLKITHITLKHTLYKVRMQKFTDQHFHIIEAALEHVAFDGWRWDVIERAAEEVFDDRFMAAALFPGRLDDAIDGFAAYLDHQMMQALENTNPDDLRIRDRIQTAVMKRIQAIQPHIEAERGAIAHWMFPLRKLRGAKILWRSADLIWDWAGDTATDYNRYTKRTLLSGVIATTTLAFLNNHQDLEATERFLERRIENVMQLGKITAPILGRFKKSA